MARKKQKSARDYRHDEKQLLRPESGAQDVFPSGKRKAPQAYRHDSSLSPELFWDEAEARGAGEQLIDKIIASETLDEARQAAEKLKGLSKPFLNWAGKGERGSFSVPTLPLFIHERLSTAAVLETLKRHRRDRQQTLDLFGEGDKSIGEKIRGAYEHLNGWQNRLILGDSLQVMNSLLGYESLSGQVQMVYMDPPYGIKFGSNFQPFVRRRNVKDGEDDALSREPEMVQAYRDTWELGRHSWLTYMRDRLLLIRELLSDSGSCFVQISDENVHHVREIMDEVFGAENFARLISYRTTSGLVSKLIPTSGDYIVWYAKDKEKIKHNRLFVHDKPFGRGTMFTHILKANGEDRPMNERELDGLIDKGDRPYRLSSLVSSGLTPSCVFDFEFEGQTFQPTKGKSWRTNEQGMKALRDKKRLMAPGDNLQYVFFYDDYPVGNLSNFWTDVGGELDKRYVVQTAKNIIQRCMLMTTDPGDLVFDPTCGSGTTACVAEQWGRRWITTDVSRVPLALARQRLLTATYPYYQLQDKQRGPSGGFVYKRKKNNKGEEVGGIVPHITLKSIANDEPPAEEVLVDKPEKESNVIRISGPFCVEAVLPTPLSPEVDKAKHPQIEEESSSTDAQDSNEENHIPRMIEVLRLSPALRLPQGNDFKLSDIRPVAKSMNLHAEGKSVENKEPLAIVFGPANGAISDRAVVEAGQEARRKGYARLVVIAFAIEPAARQTIEKGEDTIGIPAVCAHASPDLVMSDLLKNMRSSQIFFSGWLA